MDEVKKLRRPKKDRMLAGVCAGIANYLGWDIGLTRFIWACFTILGGLSIWAYIIAWFVIPEEE